MFNYDGDFYALEDRCIHEDFELSAGSFDGDEATIECVLHGAKFDVRDGRALCRRPTRRCRKFPVKVEDGAVWTRDDALTLEAVPDLRIVPIRSSVASANRSH